MREGIHPNYVECTVVCACGNTFQTRSTKPSIRLEICSNCHPFFTGRQKFVDTAGRVERFQKRFAKTAGETMKKKAEAPKMAKGQKAGLSRKHIKILSSAPIRIPAKPGSGGKAFASTAGGRSPEGGRPPTKAPAPPKAH
jgi:large subunit ribosomal protein L31